MRLGDVGGGSDGDETGNGDRSGNDVAAGKDDGDKDKVTLIK